MSDKPTHKATANKKKQTRMKLSNNKSSLIDFSSFINFDLMGFLKNKSTSIQKNISEIESEIKKTVILQKNQITSSGKDFEKDINLKVDQLITHLEKNKNIVIAELKEKFDHMLTFFLNDKTSKSRKQKTHTKNKSKK